MSRKHDRGMLVNDLTELNGALSGLNIEPVLDFDLNLEGMDEALNKKFTACKNLHTQIGVALAILDKMEKMFSGYTTSLERKIAHEKVGSRKQKAEEFIQAILDHKDLIYRSVAAKATLMHYFTVEVKSLEDRDWAVAKLENYKLLVRETTGPIYIGHQRFAISDQFGLDNEERQEVGKVYEQFNHAVEQLEKTRRQENTAVMKEVVTLDFNQFMAGALGKYVLEVPPRQLNERKQLGGGKLFLEVINHNGKLYVTPRGAFGSIERPVAAMIEEYVVLGHDDLFTNEPPRGSELTKEIQESYDLDYSEAVQHIRKIHSLWYMCQRGIRQVAEQQEDLQEMKRLEGQATISAEEFFGLGQTNKVQEGIAFLEFSGVFKDKEGNKEYHNLALLVERKNQDGTSMITVIDTLMRHIELLEPYIGNAYEANDSVFGKVPIKLSRIIRAIRSQKAKNLQVNSSPV
jgi:hypothetical protein